MPPPPGLGVTLRAIRQAQGWSLSQVSEAIGLSTSFLSLVEQGKSDITLNRLMSLVKFYKVGLADLVPEQAEVDDVVVRRQQRKRVSLSAEGFEITLLAPDTKRIMMPLLTTFAPGGQTANHALHDGEEFVLVLSGRMLLDLGGAEPIVLEKGDSAYFDASRSHQYTNLAEGPTRVFAVITPPTL